MKSLLVVAGLLVAFSAPANAQTMPNHTMPNHTMSKKKMMMAPTMAQCEGGYKRSYRASMDWSRKKYNKACRSMKMKMGKSKTM